jgi:glutaredoxin
MNHKEKNKVNVKATQILEKITKNKNIYLLFGISTCGYCKKALSYVKENNMQFKYYEMDKYYKYFIPILQKLIILEPSLNIKSEHDTFPVIFYNDKFIGGYTDLIKSDTSNIL